MKDREENGTVYSVRERLRGELTFLSLFFFASLFFFFFPFFFRNFANFAEAAATLAALSESESMSSPFELLFVFFFQKSLYLQLEVLKDGESKGSLPFLKVAHKLSGGVVCCRGVASGM